MNLNLHIPINTTSYGQVGYNFAKQLNKIANIKIHPIGQIDYDEELYQKLAFDEYYLDAPVLKIWHQQYLSERIAAGKYFAMPIFETRLCKRSIAHCNAVDQIIVNSKWAADIIADQTRHTALICELGVNTDIFFPSNSLKKKKYTFLHIGKKERRKNQDFIIYAFNRAFEKNDDVELILCWHNKFLTPEENAEYDSLLNTPLRNKIKVVGPFQTSSEVADLIRYSDCGIYPSRAEGYGLPIIETMACCKPVITTNYSAMTQYCTPENSYLIDIDNMCDAYDPKWKHFSGFEWADFGEKQLEQCVNYMRECYNNRPDNPKGLEKARELSWKNCAEKLLNLIKTNC